MRIHGFKIKEWLLATYLFMGIFLPPISSYSSIHLVLVLSFFIIIVGLYEIRNATSIRYSIIIVRGFLPFALYYISAQLVRCFVDSSTATIYSDFFVQTIKVFAFCFIICTALIVIIQLFRFSVEEMVNSFMKAMIIQLVCVIASFISPSIRSGFLNQIINYSKSELVVRAIERHNFHRCYGFASNLFDSFGYLTALLILVTFVYGIHTKKHSIILISFLMLIAPLLNARTGMVLVFIGVLVTLLYYMKIKNLLRIMLWILVFVILFTAFYNLLPQSIQEFLGNGLKEIDNLMNGKASDGIVFREIFDNDFVFPDNILLGAGASPEAIGNYRGVDSGYIQCIWRYGIIGTILLFVGYIRVFHLSYNSINCKGVKVISLCFMIVFFTYLFKLYSIINYGSVFLIFGIPTILKYYGDKGKGCITNVPKQSTSNNCISDNKRYYSNIQEI